MLFLSLFFFWFYTTICMHIVHYIVFEAARVQLHSPRQCESETGRALLSDVLQRSQNTHTAQTHIYYRSSLLLCFVSFRNSLVLFTSLRFVSLSCIQQQASSPVCVSVYACVFNGRRGRVYKISRFLVYDHLRPVCHRVNNTSCSLHIHSFIC